VAARRARTRPEGARSVRSIWRDRLDLWIGSRAGGVLDRRARVRFGGR
jgi:hypothetical protein